MKGKIVFEEEQSFLGSLTWYLVLLIAAGTLIPFVVFMAVQPAIDQEAVAGLIIIIVTLVPIVLLFSLSKLRVVIDEGSIYYRFPPFVRRERQLTKADIEHMEMRKFKPIREFGGYGYRYRFKSGVGLIIAGNMGLQLVKKDGKRLLLGTQRPQEMEEAVKKLKENWNLA